MSRSSQHERFQSFIYSGQKFMEEIVPAVQVFWHGKETGKPQFQQEHVHTCHLEREGGEGEMKKNDFLTGPWSHNLSFT